LDAAQNSEVGQLLRRALDPRAALKLGLKLSLGESGADEFQAMLIIEGEQARWEEERSRRNA